jgi:hypothetical protein
MNSAVNEVEIYSERPSQVYIMSRCHWYGVIVMNMHSPAEDKREDANDGFDFRRT